MINITSCKLKNQEKILSLSVFYQKTFNLSVSYRLINVVVSACQSAFDEVVYV